MEVGVSREAGDGFEKGLARGRTEEKLPGETFGAAFVKGWGRSGDGETRGVTEGAMEGLDVAENDGFGLVGEVEPGEVSEGWESAGFTTFEQVLGEGCIIILYSRSDDWMVWLVGLKKDLGSIEMATTDAANDLSK